MAAPLFRASLTPTSLVPTPRRAQPFNNACLRLYSFQHRPIRVGAGSGSPSFLARTWIKATDQRKSIKNCGVLGGDDDQHSSSHGDQNEVVSCFLVL